MSNVSAQTPLHDWHEKNGANMADFGGYHMPLWYASAKNEHLAVLRHAGLFDTSHMAVVMVNGPDAFDLLQACFTSNLAACIGAEKKPLYPGRCAYGAFLDDNGHVIDDAIVFQLAAADYMVVVNAGMGGPIAAHLNRYKNDREATIADLTDQVGKIDIQGPAAVQVLYGLLKDPERVFNRLPYFGFKGHFRDQPPADDTVRFKDGTPALVSRTGYTGEIGFEIFCDPDRVNGLWEKILEAGKPLGVLACGLAARDSLRAGAVLPLSHQDIGHWPFIHHPWHFALPFNKDQTGFTKPFVGSNALLDIDSPQYTYAFVGNDLRKVSTADWAAVLDTNGAAIGRVLTCVTDMGIGWYQGRIYSVASPDKPADFKAKGLCCGFIRTDCRLADGETVHLEDKRRTIAVRITEDIRPDRTARHRLKNFMPEGS